MDEVIINIKGTQTVDGEDEIMELTTVGKLSEKDGKWYLRYDENEMIGQKGVSTLLKIIDEHQVVMQRTGNMNTRLTVEKGQRHMSHYDTGMGQMRVGIFGEKIENAITADGGRFYMSYTIDVNYDMVSRNQVEISVKKTGKSS